MTTENRIEDLAGCLLVWVFQLGGPIVAAWFAWESFDRSFLGLVAAVPSAAVGYGAGTVVYFGVLEVARRVFGIGRNWHPPTE